MMSNPITRAHVRLRCSEHARVEMMSGVTTLLATGNAGAVDAFVRDWINIAHSDGPRILATNAAVTVPGGRSVGVSAKAVSGEGEAAACVRKIAEGKPDALRLLVSDGDARMPAGTVRACCEEAHALGLKVIALARDGVSARAALENGADVIEGAAGLDAELMGLMREKGVPLICRMPPAPSEADPAGDAACAGEAMKAGITVGLGSCAGHPYSAHYDMWRAVYRFQRLTGVDNGFALHTATSRNAGILGLGDTVGSIEEGKCADLFVTDKSPLEDLSALREPTMVVVRGTVMSPRQFKDKRSEKALDRLM